MPADPYYSSAGWQTLRRACLDRDHWRCTTPRCGARATFADHVIPRRKGGPDALTNLASLCRACHGRKSARQDGALGHAPSRSRPVGADGWPV